MLTDRIKGTEISLKCFEFSSDMDSAEQDLVQKFALTKLRFANSHPLCRLQTKLKFWLMLKAENFRQRL